MTTPSDAVSQSSFDPRPATPAVLPEPRPLYWSVRRELWETRSLYIAPLIAAGVVMFGFVISTVGMAARRHAVLDLDPAAQSAMIALPYEIGAMVIIITAIIVGAFYCLGALHNERRDRSILFWKSLPVSDLTTVLSKASVPLVILPAIVFVVVVAMQLAMLVLTTAILLANGPDAATTWTRVPWLQMWLVLLYGLAVLALWYAPIWAWLLLVSGWARRAPFLWAVLPPLALCVIEKIAFNTGHFASLLAYRFGGFSDAFRFGARAGEGHGRAPNVDLTQIDPIGFLSNPGLWLGLVVAVAFLAAAVWRRRRGDPV
jgi:ABC-2 type transport system permease protein